MPHNFPVPEETKLEQLIVQVYEALPEAEYSRLQRIEERLSRKARLQKREKTLNKIPWWIVLLLAGGFATAAWWVGERFVNDRDIINSDKVSVSSDKIIQSEPDKEKSEPNMQNIIQDDEIDRKNDSPIIYQREPF